MRRIIMGTVWLAVVLLGGCTGAPPTPATTEVVVVSTLHFFHGRVDYYTYEDLARIVRDTRPDVLALELNPRELRERPGELGMKAEYPLAIFPLMEDLGIPAVAMEPDEPLWSELVEKRRAGEAELGRARPETSARFDAYTDALYATLFDDLWDSPEAVNSDTTDRILAGKHALQDALHDADQYASWHEWNDHFLRQIRAAAEQAPGGRVVVVVGVEHGYWLKDALRSEPGFRLLSLQDALRPH